MFIDVLRLSYFLWYKLANWCTKYSVQEVVPHVVQEVVPQDFTNLFNNWEDHKDFPDAKLIDKLTSTPNISTFMLVELMDRPNPLVQQAYPIGL